MFQDNNKSPWKEEPFERTDSDGNKTTYTFINKGGGFVDIVVNSVNKLHSFRLASDVVGRKEIFSSMVDLIELSFGLGIEHGRKEFALKLREMAFYGK